MESKTVNMDTMPLRWGHYKLFIKTSSGQFIGSGLATLIGIILPMIQLVVHPELSSVEQGILSCMSLIGIVIGSSVIGDLSDTHGYLFYIRLCPLLILSASLFAYFTGNLWALGIGLFLMGVGIGGEYSLGSDYISEVMPKKYRLVMVGAAKATSALGSILVAVLSYLFLKWSGNPEQWNKLLLIISAIAFLMFISRISFRQSPGWLIAKGKFDEAEKVVKYFLGNDVVIGTIKKDKTKEGQTTKSSIKDLFTQKDNIRKVIFSGIPWACEGFGVYGIGIFLPILIMALGIEHSSSIPTENIIKSIQTTAIVNIFILIGFVIGLFFVNKLYHVFSQTWGFLISCIGILILWFTYIYHLPIEMAILGFFIFEIFLNAGPHLMTFIIPPQIYSVEERGAGVGLAASIGKIGAVLAVFFIPNLLKWGGISLVLMIAIIVNITGAAITYFVGRKVLPPKKRITLPYSTHHNN